MRLMIIGYQGEPHSYSFRAAGALFPDAELRGHPSFVRAFRSLRNADVSFLVLPIANSTTGPILPVLDRLVAADASIKAEHVIHVRHALMGVPGATLESAKSVRSHPVALGQAEALLEERGWEAVATSDTAGAVREVAEHQDPAELALADPAAGEAFGLEILMEDAIDQDHNTTRFVVLEPGKLHVRADDNKTSIAFETPHTPGALALALTELGLRGANLTMIESRPGGRLWRYMYYVDFLHEPGPDGLAKVLEPAPMSMSNIHMLGSYPAEVL